MRNKKNKLLKIKQFKQNFIFKEKYNENYFYFINCLFFSILKNGKKDKIWYLYYKIFLLLKKYFLKEKKFTFEYFFYFIRKNLYCPIFLKMQHVGPVKYFIPVISIRKSIFLSKLWLLEGLKKRTERTFILKLFMELVDIFNKHGFTINFRTIYYKSIIKYKSNLKYLRLVYINKYQLYNKYNILKKIKKNNVYYLKKNNNYYENYFNLFRIKRIYLKKFKYIYNKKLKKKIKTQFFFKKKNIYISDYKSWISIQIKYYLFTNIFYVFNPFFEIQKKIVQNFYNLTTLSKIMLKCNNIFKLFIFKFIFKKNINKKKLLKILFNFEIRYLIMIYIYYRWFKRQLLLKFFINKKNKLNKIWLLFFNKKLNSLFKYIIQQISKKLKK